MMAKNVDEAKAVDIAGAAPVTPVPTRINSEEEAAAWIKRGGYKVPAGCNKILVTEDRNVFWGDHENDALNHAYRNNLKIFTLNEWTK